jgi:acylphosphatase
MNARVHLIISGRVQGVFYRANTRHFASELRVKGWVRNLQDGKVEVVAEGGKNALDRLIEFCRKGPEGSIVENIDIKWEKPSDEFTSFDVRF